MSGMANRHPSERTWAKLHRLAQAIEDQQDALYDLVKEARENEDALTWQEIADALGITRQAAWERFTQVRLRPMLPKVHPDQGKLV